MPTALARTARQVGIDPVDEDGRPTANRHAAGSVPPSGDTPMRPAVGGTLMDALDTALVAAWEDDPLIAAFCQDEGLVGAVADLEFAIEVLRSGLGRFGQPDQGGVTKGQQK